MIKKKSHSLIFDSFCILSASFFYINFIDLTKLIQVTFFNYFYIIFFLLIKFSQYCASTGTSYFSYSFYCPPTSSQYSITNSFNTATNALTTGTYSYSQYCKTYKQYYYKKSYVCPDNLSNSVNSLVKAGSNALGAIIGGVVGVIVFIIILIVICCCCCCKKATAKTVDIGSTASHSSSTKMDFTQQPMMQPAPVIINV